jgi:hypothetical protein
MTTSLNPWRIRPHLWLGLRIYAHLSPYPQFFVCLKLKLMSVSWRSLKIAEVLTLLLPMVCPGLCNNSFLCPSPCLFIWHRGESGRTWHVEARELGLVRSSVSIWSVTAAFHMVHGKSDNFSPLIASWTSPAHPSEHIHRYPSRIPLFGQWPWHHLAPPPCESSNHHQTSTILRSKLVYYIRKKKKSQNPNARQVFNYGAQFNYLA